MKIQLSQKRKEFLVFVTSKLTLQLNSVIFNLAAVEMEEDGGKSKPGAQYGI
jgi:hypothetical protein